MPVMEQWSWLEPYSNPLQVRNKAILGLGFAEFLDEIQGLLEGFPGVMVRIIDEDYMPAFRERFLNEDAPLLVAGLVLFGAPNVLEFAATAIKVSMEGLLKCSTRGRCVDLWQVSLDERDDAIILGVST